MGYFYHTDRVKTAPPPGLKHTPLTDKQYGWVKEMQQQDEKPVEIAHELELPLQHVNYALLSRTYEAYQAHLATVK